MKKNNIFINYLLTIIFCTSFPSICHAKILAGNINKEDFLEKPHVVIDGATGNPVSGAKISIPSAGIFARTNNSGEFNLDGNFRNPVIMSVKADGYKPFSLTVSEGSLNKPLMLIITKLAGNENVIDSQLHHLGDDNYSANSANSGDFKQKSEGHYFFKEFYVGKIPVNNAAILKLGSIIGLDTEMAKAYGQSKFSISSSTTASVYLNSKKVGEININEDDKEIYLNKKLLRANSYNTLRIETGINKASRHSIDYDDFEFMNLLLVFK